MKFLNAYYTRTWLLLTAVLIPLLAGAQTNSGEADRLRLSLQEATDLALEQNFTIEQAAYDADKSQSQFRQTNAVFLPQLTVEYNALSTDDPLNVFGFKLKQERVTQQDFNPVLLNDPETTENYSASLNVRQPLLNPDILMKRRAARHQMESANEQLNGTRDMIEFQVRNQYYSLILYRRQIEVLETALETASEHRRQAQNYFEQGMISKEDYLAARVYELEMESQKISTENKLSEAEEGMALLLGLDGITQIIPSDDLSKAATVPLSENLIQAPVTNSMTRAIDLRVKAAEAMVTSANFSFLPKINLFGSYEFNDSEFAGFDASSYTIGANLTWNLFSGFSNIGKQMEATADYRKAQSMQESNQLEQQRQVRNAYRGLEHARHQLELADESIARSEEDVKIRSNRFDEGMARTTDLLEAETKLAEARLNQIAALYSYNINIARLEMLLERNLTN